MLPREPTRFYPVCIAAKRAAPPEECGGAWAYMAQLDQHRYHPPVDALLIAADAARALLEADADASVRDAVPGGDRGSRRAARGRRPSGGLPAVSARVRRSPRHQCAPMRLAL